MPLLLLPAAVSADPLRIAVASNFAAALEELAAAFETEGGARLDYSSASTGKHFAQIVNGAPFDILLAADVERPRQLEQNGAGVPGSRFTYAIGRLVLWSRDEALAGASCREALAADEEGRVAIANPRTAPYGYAARDALVSIGLWDRLRQRVVLGENIAQTLQFAASGNARFGFVAAAQLIGTDLPATACRWPVPGHLHAPIEQQAILLTRAGQDSRARAFLDFMAGKSGRAIIAASGYALPAAD